MHVIESTQPSPALKPYVRAYAERNLGPVSQPSVEPVPARLEQVLEFELDSPFKVRFFGGHTIESPRITVVGWQTRLRSELQLPGQVRSFAVFFQPAGFFHLFGVPVEVLRDNFFEATAVLGQPVRTLWNELGEAGSFLRRVEIIERYLKSRIERARTSEISVCADRILHSRGLIDINLVARHLHISPRHLERRFKEHTGLSPKAFSRIARFQTALDLKVSTPKLSWLNIAHGLGYYDQMHLIHDFHSLCGSSPNDIFLRLGSARPEAVAAVSNDEELIELAHS